MIIPPDIEQALLRGRLEHLDFLMWNLARCREAERHAWTRLVLWLVVLAVVFTLRWSS